MTIATQNQNTTTQARVRALIVDGIYPSGDVFSDTVQAGSSFEAMIRVLADRRYSDDGGDLSISSVFDADTGDIVDGPLLSAQSALLSEAEAIEQVLEQVTSILSSASFDTDAGRGALGAYMEYFGLVLAEAPFAFEAISKGAGEMSREDMTLEYEDFQGVVHEFEPAVALLALAEVALQREVNTAALQVKTLATVARSTFNLAAIDALSAD